MFYKMAYDMDKFDELSEKGQSFIYAEQSNLKSIEYSGIKKGWFHSIALKELSISFWPKVEFYFNSTASNLESDLLLNVDRWPIIHKRVKEVLEKEITGISFYPVTLVDINANLQNTNYYFMYIRNFIDAFDMERSEYRYIEKYNAYAFIPHKTYLNLNVCQKYDIFRCNKSPASIYVSERFRKIIVDNNFNCFFFYNQKC